MCLKTILFLLITTSINAQIFWEENDNSTAQSEANDVHILNDSVVVVSYIDQNCFGGNKFKSYSIHENFVSTEQFNELSGLFIQNHQNEYHSLNIKDEGDVFLYKYSFQKFDLNGQKIWENTSGHEFYEQDDIIEAVDWSINNEGVHLIAGKSNSNKYGVIQFDSSANFVTQKLLNLAEEAKILSAQWLNLDTFLLSATQQIFLMDKDYNKLDSVNLNTPILQAYTIDDTLYTVDSNKIVRYNHDLEIIDAVVLDFPYQEIIIKKFAQSLYVFSKGPQAKLYQMVNTQLQTIQNFNLPFSAVNFALQNDSIFIVGNSMQNQNVVMALSLQQSDVIPEIDVKINQVEIYDLEEVYETRFNEEVHIGYRFKYRFQINNESETALHNIGLAIDLFPGFGAICHEIPYVYIDQLNIAPNETGWVTPNEKLFRYGQSSNIEICFTLYAPNKLLESELENNEYCDDFIFTHKTKIPKHQLSIYPNPSNGIFYIEGAPNNAIINLSDLQGKTLHHEILKEDKKLNLTHLPSGLYILAVDNLVEKIIKK